MNVPFEGYTIDALASIESEQAILGGLMLDNGLWELVGDILTPADFFREEHRRIFTAISQLVMANKPADIVTVFDRIGGNIGVDVLNALAQFVPSARNARQYAENVRQRSLSRQLMGTSNSINELALDHSRPIEERVEQATAHLAKLLEGAPRDDWEEPDAGMVAFLDGIQRRADGEEDFLPTGLRALDDRLDGGMRVGEVIVIAGRPGMGKTSLAMSIAEHAAKAHSVPTGVLSMEMPKPQLHNRRVSMHSRIPLHKIKRPERMSSFDWGQMVEAVDSIRQLPVFISDQTALTINQVRTKARALKRRRGLRLLVIDYIGLMEGTDKRANRATQLGEVSRGIKALAKELGITVLLLAQLNREVEKRPNMRPIMADLRECGDIEQDADVILFVHRPAHVKPELAPEWKHYAEIIIGKQRDGQTGKVDAQYIGESVIFTDWPTDQPVPTSSKTSSKWDDL